MHWQILIIIHHLFKKKYIRIGLSHLILLHRNFLLKSSYWLIGQILSFGPCYTGSALWSKLLLELRIPKQQHALTFYYHYYYFYIINFFIIIITISSMYFYLQYKICWDLLCLDSYFYHCNFKLKFCTLQWSAYFRDTFITYLVAYIYIYSLYIYKFSSTMLVGILEC